MAWGAVIGGVLGAAGSYLGSKEQTKAAEKQQKRMIAQLNGAANGLEEDYNKVIADIMANPVGYAGSRVQAAMYNPVSLAQSLRGTIGANYSNLPGASQLSSATNQATLSNDLNRANTFSPGILQSLLSLSGNASKLASGQLPQDAIQNLISSRASSSAANGTPGGAGPATLRDLGLSSLDAMNQGASLWQQVLQGAEAISPISRQLSPAQYQLNPQTGLQTDLQQALLQQQSQQNAYNLAATPDPALAMQAQLKIQMANNSASTRAGIAGLSQSPQIPYAQIYGQLGTSLGQGIAGLFGGGGGGGSGGGGGFSSGFGSYSSPSAYNAYASNYNQNLSGGAAPKAYIV